MRFYSDPATAKVALPANAENGAPYPASKAQDEPVASGGGDEEQVRGEHPPPAHAEYSRRRHSVGTGCQREPDGRTRPYVPAPDGECGCPLRRVPPNLLRPGPLPSTACFLESHSFIWRRRAHNQARLGATNKAALEHGRAHSRDHGFFIPAVL